MRLNCNLFFVYANVLSYKKKMVIRYTEGKSGKFYQPIPAQSRDFPEQKLKYFSGCTSIEDPRKAKQK